MEHRTEYFDPNDISIPPQLSKADIGRMTAEQIAKADDNQQFVVLKSGRDPLPVERKGERLGRPDEIAAQARVVKAEQNRAKFAAYDQARKEGI